MLYRAQPGLQLYLLAGFLLVVPGLVIPGIQRAFVDYYMIAGLEGWLWWLGIASLASASAASILLGFLALTRRKRGDLMGHALLSPLYWLPISCAAYRAMHEWRTSPFYWAKTPHVGTADTLAVQDVRPR